MVAPFTVFGYGSLIFKPPPHTISQVHGFLKGYVRRFAQSSHDHRGTDEYPGRVVTLVHKEDWVRFSEEDAFPDEDVVWGIAYTIDSAYEAEVRDYLGDIGRLLLTYSQDGYTMESLDIYGIVDGKEQIVIRNVRYSCCYVGRNDNPSFVGSEPLDVLAHRISRSVGPSGPNKEYLYKLAESIRELSPDSFDSHLFALEAKVKQLDSNRIPR
ncbi:hypothetical protein AGABI2DRAFT_228326 [Agaricus bisporus var. bisporus H97]|uniref:hypothetical protein n=1 Tax=Agaricus bisporus var. bisporus (strain H97 / ATCC MYA-4626 / FGSC 10389) TaxID=936046 RepID=UPI00029F652B|nr:hypothetical protein AGABI2DRAFT_228326 [Agaricus bisporus var. bisporus H97]EKV42708.1 hypothetical protein AGABI2DRAFT_228326 [Agaricus bisporus var. bisporus H97]